MRNILVVDDEKNIGELSLALEWRYETFTARSGAAWELINKKASTCHHRLRMPGWAAMA